MSMLHDCPHCQSPCEIADHGPETLSELMQCMQCGGVFAPSPAFFRTAEAPAHTPSMPAKRGDALTDILISHTVFSETMPTPPADAAPPLALDGLDVNTMVLPEPETGDIDDTFHMEVPKEALADNSPAPALPPQYLDDTPPEATPPPPRFIASPPRLPTQPRQWKSWFAVAGLLLLLLGQSLFAERNTLAANSRWRPWLERGCQWLACTLPAWHEPGALHLMARDVRPHPSVPNALMINASFRNDARWAQDWPRLQLSLSDLDGQTIAQREFQPDEYLGLTAHATTIEAGQTASITLEVRDPGKQAVAFEFDFH